MFEVNGSRYSADWLDQSNDTGFSQRPCKANVEFSVSTKAWCSTEVVGTEQLKEISSFPPINPEIPDLFML